MFGMSTSTVLLIIAAAVPIPVQVAIVHASVCMACTAVKSVATGMFWLGGALVSSLPSPSSDPPLLQHVDGGDA